MSKSRQRLDLPCEGRGMAIGECSDEFEHVLQRQARAVVPHGVLVKVELTEIHIDSHSPDLHRNEATHPLLALHCEARIVFLLLLVLLIIIILLLVVVVVSWLHIPKLNFKLNVAEYSQIS